MLGSWAELVGDVGAVVEEKLRDRIMYSHEAHMTGASIGMALAFLFDMVFPKKGFPTKLLWKLIPVAVIGILYYENEERKKMFQ